MSNECITYVKLKDLGEHETPALRLLLYVIAENTFNDTFLCKLTQGQLAFEAGRITERSVRRHLDTLESEARLIARTERFRPEGGRLPDAIEVLGFREWYQAQRGALSGGLGGRKPPPIRPAPEPGTNGEIKPDNLAGMGGQPENLSGIDTGQQESGHTGQQESGSIEDSRTAPVQEYPPPPRKRGARERDRQLIDQVLERVLDGHPERERIVRGLIEPLVRRRKLGGVADQAYALAVLADWPLASGLDDEGCRAVVERVAAERGMIVKASDIEQAVRQEAPASGKRKAIAAAAERQAGLASPEVRELWSRARRAALAMVGEAEFRAWLAILVAVGLEGGVLTLAAPNEVIRRWAESNYAGVLLRAAQAAGGVVESVRVVRLADTARAA